MFPRLDPSDRDKSNPDFSRGQKFDKSSTYEVDAKILIDGGFICGVTQEVLYVLVINSNVLIRHHS